MDVNVSSSATIQESVTLQIPIKINKSDSITVSTFFSSYYPVLRVNIVQSTTSGGGAASSILKYPTAAVSQTSPGSAAWNNPGNVYVEDGVVSSTVNFNTVLTCRFLFASGFGFTIPVGSSIVGIRMGVKRASNVAGPKTDKSIRLSNGAGYIGSDYATSTAWPSSLTWAYYGGPTDTWGRTWTVAEVNSAGFGAGVQPKNINSTSCNAQIDVFSMEVWYSAPAVGMTDIPVVKERSFINISNSQVTNELVNVHERDFIHISDSQTTIEANNFFIPLLTLNILESEVVSDMFTHEVISSLSVIDEEIISERLSTGSSYNLSVFDSTTIVESTNELESFYNVNILDEEIISEVFETHINPLFINVSATTIGNDVITSEVFLKSFVFSFTVVADTSILFQPYYDINIISSIGIIDTVIVKKISNIHVIDTVIINELKKVIIPIEHINTSSIQSISEKISIKENKLKINVSDSIIVHDSPNIRFLLSINVIDPQQTNYLLLEDGSFILQENGDLIILNDRKVIPIVDIASTSIKTYVNKFDSTNIRELLNIRKINNVNVLDSSIVKDKRTILIPIKVNVSESQVVLDRSFDSRISRINVLDSSNLSELIILEKISNVNIFDSVNIRENDVLHLSKLSVFVSDLVDIEETMFIRQDLRVLINDIIIINELINISSICYINKFDSINILDFSIIKENFYPLIASDSILISDIVSITSISNINSFDRITILDTSTLVFGHYLINIYDSQRINELILISKFIHILIYESQIIGESILLFFPWLIHKPRPAYTSDRLEKITDGYIVNNIEEVNEINTSDRLEKITDGYIDDGSGIDP